MTTRPSTTTPPPDRSPRRSRAKPTPTPVVPPSERWENAEALRWATRHWAARIGVKTPVIHLRLMTRKWGSISTSGRMTLNTELLDLPKDLGEFVIVHELVHLLAPNHGPVFKLFMHAYLPDWQQKEKALQQHTQGQLRYVKA